MRTRLSFSVRSTTPPPNYASKVCIRASYRALQNTILHVRGAGDWKSDTTHKPRHQDNGARDSSLVMPSVCFSASSIAYSAMLTRTCPRTCPAHVASHQRADQPCKSPCASQVV